MTDTDRMVAWLRETMGTVEGDAEAMADEPWRVVSTAFGPEVCIGDDDLGNKWSREGQGVDAAYRCDDPDDDCGGARWGYLAEGRQIAAHASPAAVLRRIAADRKTLDDCDDVLHDFVFGAFRKLAEDTIHNLAEGWGWTEEGQR